MRLQIAVLIAGIALLVMAICSFTGFLIALFTAWLGGELVDRMGVGVDEGAHLDAPGSLTSSSAVEHRPAA